MSLNQFINEVVLQCEFSVLKWLLFIVIFLIVFATGGYSRREAR